MKPNMLIILDGWGFSEALEGNAVKKAHTPNMDRFFADNSWGLLEAAGEAVGLPAGQMGNSEVGHLNIGSGRIVYQELTRITRSIENGEFYQNPVLLSAMGAAKEKGGALHIIGLLSDGGVHSHLDHLLAILEMAERNGVHRVYIHAILDGRDTSPSSARPFLELLHQRSLAAQNGYIASICGRYFAMDRDKRWDRLEKAYRAYVFGEGLKEKDPLTALENAYRRGETDEFVKPAVIESGAGDLPATISNQDSVIFFNFRPDRARQLSHALTDKVFPHIDRGDTPPMPFFTTMTEYDSTLSVPVAFPPEYLKGTLGEVYSRNDLSQLRIAETEKYGHVTFFFNGGREEPFPGEMRILVPSPKVATYDLQPEMSAPGITRCVMEALIDRRFPFVVVNFANADMVGHTGDFQAAVKAVEAVDFSLGLITAAAGDRGWNILICGDHGNAEQMLDAQGAKHTAHTVNPVPFILLGEPGRTLRSRGILADIAPTILELAGLEPPPEMTGCSMLR